MKEKDDFLADLATMFTDAADGACESADIKAAVDDAQRP